MTDKLSLPPKLDYIFKMLFGDAENTEILEGFLRAALNLPEEAYRSLEIVDPHQRGETIELKEEILDVKLHTASGDYVNVEIQLYNRNGFRDRILSYSSGMLSQQLYRGDEYAKLKRAICIVITDFVLINENGKYRNDYYLYDKDTDSRFTDKLEILVLELPKLRDADQTLLADWLRFLNATEEDDMEELAKKDQTIKKAVGRYKELTADEANRMIAESHWWWLMDQKAREDYLSDIQNEIDKGREEIDKGRKEISKSRKEISKSREEISKSREEISKGREEISKSREEIKGQGIEQGHIDAARRMKADNMDAARIAKYTGLPVSEIEKL
ncbi:MAG: Rpn family recombination-promoting nuclease/putative transposase [Clostridiales Family XIII bacterium]|jgi:predicted transposase/invertase (TIGR01784 family)|nr:Rpn family recombination-promoting nuclease/putative transposase [Clostridiales Family XIII bacterium]